MYHYCAEDIDKAWKICSNVSIGHRQQTMLVGYGVIVRKLCLYCKCTNTVSMTDWEMSFSKSLKSANGCNLLR